MIYSVQCRGYVWAPVFFGGGGGYCKCSPVHVLLPFKPARGAPALLPTGAQTFVKSSYVKILPLNTVSAYAAL